MKRIHPGFLTVVLFGIFLSLGIQTISLRGQEEEEKKDGFQEKYRTLIERNPFVPKKTAVEAAVRTPQSAQHSFTGFWKWKNVTKVGLISGGNSLVMAVGESVNGITVKEANTDGKTPYVVLVQGGETFRVDMADPHAPIPGMGMNFPQNQMNQMNPMMPAYPTPGVANVGPGPGPGPEGDPSIMPPQFNPSGDPGTTIRTPTRRRIVPPPRRSP